jgi:hypothetical protein
LDIYGISGVSDIVLDALAFYIRRGQLLIPA